LRPKSPKSANTPLFPPLSSRTELWPNSAQLREVWKGSLDYSTSQPTPARICEPNPVRPSPAARPAKAHPARRHGHGVPGQETWTAPPPGAWAPWTPTPRLLLSSARAACALQPL
jgi:hypothetical protein